MMDLKQAQDLLGRVAETPTAVREIRTDDLLVAIATVIVRNGLLAVPSEDDK